MPRLDPPPGTGLAFGLLTDRRPLVNIDQVGPGQHDEVSPSQGFQRLPEQASGQDTTQPERLEGIDQDDVEVPSQATMLEAIIEYQDLGLQLLDRDPRGLDPVAILEVRDVGEVLLQDTTFVVESMDLLVAATQDRHPLVVSAEPSSHPLDHGCLAGAADGQVPDGDDG